jgi:hypothetical protein
MKKISLNKNSLHYKFYSWILNTTNPPKTLCPYFWSYVTIILLIPLILIVKLTSILYDLNKKNKIEKLMSMSVEELEKKEKKEIKVTKILETIGVSISILFSVVFITICFLGLFDIGNKIGWFKTIIGLFSVIGMTTTVYGLFYVLLKTNFLMKIYKSKIIQIPILMIKSLYNKSCPLVEWK